jgi:hypothetical protein
MASRIVKGRIVYSLSMFVMLFIVLSSIAIQRLQESENFRQIDESIERIDMNALDLFKTDVDFYNFDLINPDFFQSEGTPLLQRHDSLLHATRALVVQLQQVKHYQLAQDLQTVDSLLVGYDQLFKQLVVKLRTKGFKDYGLEGKLRNFAHELEDKGLIGINEILMLRRHEKDYLLRDDKQYVQQLNDRSNALINKYSKSPQITEVIKNYTNAFNDLVALSDEIGFHKQIGLKGNLNKEISALLRALDKLNHNGEEQTLQNHRKTFTMFITLTSIAVVFVIVLIYFTLRHL